METLRNCGFSCHWFGFRLIKFNIFNLVLPKTEPKIRKKNGGELMTTSTKKDLITPAKILTFV